MRVYLPGTSAESEALMAALRRAPEAAGGVCFLSVWVPGMNRFDLTALHAETRAELFFMHPALNAAARQGRVDYKPFDYERIYPASENGEPPEYAALLSSPIVALARAAAVTENLQLGTGVCLLPLHEPIALAKDIATPARTNRSGLVASAKRTIPATIAENR